MSSICTATATESERVRISLTSQAQAVHSLPRCLLVAVSNSGQKSGLPVLLVRATKAHTSGLLSSLFEVLSDFLNTFA